MISTSRQTTISNKVGRHNVNEMFLLVNGQRKWTTATFLIPFIWACQLRKTLNSDPERKKKSLWSNVYQSKTPQVLRKHSGFWKFSDCEYEKALFFRHYCLQMWWFRLFLVILFLGVVSGLPLSFISGTDFSEAP